MDSRACFNRLRNDPAFSDLSNDEIEKIVESLEDAFKKARPDQREDVLNRMKESINIKAGLSSLAVAQSKINAKKNVNLMLDNDVLIRDPITWINSIYTGATGTGLTGIKTKGGDFSLDSAVRGYEDLLKSTVYGSGIDNIEKTFPRFRKQLFSGKLDEAINQEIDGINSGNAMARDYAELLKKMDNYKVNIIRKFNPFFSTRKQRYFKKHYDPIKITRLGKNLEESRNIFINIMRNEHDLDATFGEKASDVEFVDNVFSETFDKIVGYKEADFNGDEMLQQSLADVLKSGGSSYSNARLFIPKKNGRSLSRLNELIGYGTIHNGVLKDLESASKRLGVYSKFGIDPQKTRSLMISLARNELRKRATDKNQTQKRKDQINKALSQWDRVEKLEQDKFDATVNLSYIGHSSAAKFVRNANNLAKMFVLGKATLVSVPMDVTMGITGLASQSNTNMLSASLRLLAENFKNLSPAAKKEAARFNGIIIDDYIGQYHDRFDLDNPIAGKMSKAMHGFYKLTGLTYTTDLMTASVSNIFSSMLAKSVLKAKNISALDNATKATIQRYGFTEQEFKSLKKAVIKYKGYNFIDTYELGNIDADAQAKTLAMYNDVRYSMITIPRQAEEQVFGMIGSDPDSPQAIALKNMSTFMPIGLKSLRNISRIINNSVPEAAEGLGNTVKREATHIKNVAATLTALLGAGYISYALKEYADGREPLAPTEPEAVLKAGMSSGMFSIYGDMIVSEYQYGRAASAVGNAMGPLVGKTIFPLADISMATLRDITSDKKKTESIRAAFKALNGLAPNVPIFKNYLDSLILNDFKETLSPGRGRRIQKKVREGKGLFNRRRNYIDLEDFGLKQPKDARKIHGLEKFLREVDRMTGE